MDELQAEVFRRRYLADQVETATPVQRLLMLFARLERDFDTAEAGFESNDMKAISDGLVHAQQVLFALRDPLDRSHEVGQALFSVYTYCIGRLVTANLSKNRVLIAPVRAIVSEIAVANREGAARLSGEGLVSAIEGAA